MAILHFRCKERRRTLRVSITVPVTVHGQDENGDKFRVKAKSQSVNRHGALLQIDRARGRGTDAHSGERKWRPDGGIQSGFRQARPRKQDVRGSGVYFGGFEFLAHEFPTARSQAAAPWRRLQSYRITRARRAVKTPATFQKLRDQRKRKPSSQREGFFFLWRGFRECGFVAVFFGGFSLYSQLAAG